MMRPFHSGSQYGDWTDANCGNCQKAADPDDPPPVCPCEIEQALLVAYVGSGEVTDEIARRMGKRTAGRRYCWPCPELEPKGKQS